MSFRFAKAALIAGVFFLDQLTSAWARTVLAHGHSRRLVGVIHLQLLYNRGAMLGMGSSHAHLITTLGGVGTVVIGILALRLQRGGMALALMTGGAMGNVVSRLAFHQVTDFIRLPLYPGIFNLSDVALRIGVLWFLGTWLWAEWHSRGSPSPPS